jgi:putative restriction endonuclease
LIGSLASRPQRKGGGNGQSRYDLDVSGDLEQRVRLAAFKFLDELQRGPDGDLLSRVALLRGFQLDGHRIGLVSPQQGIFKPAVLKDVPLSILTAPVRENEARPYEDAIGADGLLEYRYRGKDPGHRDNVGLRLAMQRRTPLIYFLGIVPGKYVAAYPVFIVGDRPKHLSFTVSVDERRFASLGTAQEASETEIRRRYITREIQQRVHQREFRERVLDAYRRTCAVCRLKRQELHDAAHIIGDIETDGVASVTNGISLCKLHHSAFDVNIMGIRPDYTIHIREDILHEVDGPMLIHGLQEWNGQRLSSLPSGSKRPDPARLEVRYQSFLAAGR